MSLTVGALCWCVVSPTLQWAQHRPPGKCLAAAWNCCTYSTTQMCTTAPSCPLQEKLTHRWPLNLLLYPIWLSHVASAFHCTAANTHTVNPCLIVSAGIGTHCSSAWRLAAAWKSYRSLKDRGVRECSSGNPGPSPPWSSDYLMKALEGVRHLGVKIPTSDVAVHISGGKKNSSRQCRHSDLKGNRLKTDVWVQLCPSSYAIRIYR